MPQKPAVVVRGPETRMVHLFDIMKQAQSGAAMDNIGRQFGLSIEQTQRAVEALLPAFTLGFQRSMQNPNAFAQLLEMMSSGRYAPFYDGGSGMGAGAASGQAVLERLFGSPEISRQIAAQASAATGIGAQVLQQMLPNIAAVIMGGLFKQASVEGFAGFLRGWADWLGHIAPANGRPRQLSDAAGNLSNAWRDFVMAMLGGHGPAARREPEPSAAMAQWADLMRAFTSAMPGAKAPAPPPPPPPSAPNPFEMLSEMFETGREAQAQHLAGLQAIMADLWTPKRAG